MDIEGFAQFHTPSLEIDEVRNNLILTILAEAEYNPAAVFRVWSLGAPGACAVQKSRRPIVLGQLLVAEWLLEFSREALPHEPEPDREKSRMIVNTSFGL